MTYLEIQVSQNIVLVPMDRIQEVINISASLVMPVANMPEAVLGLVSHRSRAYWTLDLAKILGFLPLGNPAKYAGIVVATATEVLVFATTAIIGIHKSPHLVDFPQNLDNYFVKNPENGIMTLNPQALIAAEIDRLKIEISRLNLVN